MRTRILSTVGGAVVGIAISAPVQDLFKISTQFSLIACGAAGLLVGYGASLLWDVFSDAHQV